MLYIGIQAQETVSDTILVDKLAMQDDRWTHVNYSVDMPAGSPGFETACCWILGVYPEIKTLRDYIDRQLNAYEEFEPYDEKKFLKLYSKKEGADVNLCYIKPKGNAIGNLQIYSVENTNRSKGEKMFFELSIVYDKVKDKVLMVDDIFVPEMTTKIKSDFGENFINMDVSDFRILCGYANGGEGFDYRDHIYNYSQHERDLTDEFKQSIGFRRLQNSFAEKEKEAEEKIFDNNQVHISSKLRMEWESLKEFFDKNFHWPNVLKKKDYYTPFITSWIVEKDGSINDVHIIMADSTLCKLPLEQEMERVLNLIPCTPGLINNIPVRTHSLLFFEFNRKKVSGIELGVEDYFSIEKSIVRQRQYDREQMDRARWLNGGRNPLGI